MKLYVSQRGKITIVVLVLLMLNICFNNQVSTGDQPLIRWSLNDNLQNSSDWIEMSPAIAPPGRYHHWGQTAYDSQSDRVILFSGDNGNYAKIFNDTWAYDYNSNTWENLTTPETKNVARYAASMAYDSESDRTIVFGGWRWEPGTPEGTNKSTGVGETWSYDYETNTWTNLTTENSPPFRGCNSMSYDEKNDRMIVYGGFHSKHYETPETTLPFFQDTWSYDYNTNTWTNMSPSTSPGPLGNHESVYDSESDKTILFGGRSCRNCGSHSETWAYDYLENTWTNLNPANPPSPRVLGMMAYNSKVDRILFFGGVDLASGNSFRDTWSYDYNSNTWTNMNSPTPPSQRYSHSFDYDSESDVAILFGGYGRAADTTKKFLDDSWAYHYQANTPSAPRNLQVSLADGEISLSWETPLTEAGSPITDYVLYRGSDADSLAEYATVQGKETFTFVDNEVSKGTMYFYAVRAKNAVGESKNSNIVSIQIPSPAPGFSLLILSISLLVHTIIWRRRKPEV